MISPSSMIVSNHKLSQSTMMKISGFVVE